MKREQQLFSAAAVVLFLGLASPLPASAHEARPLGPRQARHGDFKVECNAAAQQEIPPAAWPTSIPLPFPERRREIGWPRPIRPAAWPIGAAP